MAAVTLGWKRLLLLPLLLFIGCGGGGDAPPAVVTVLATLKATLLGSEEKDVGDLLGTLDRAIRVQKENMYRAAVSTPCIVENGSHCQVLDAVPVEVTQRSH